MAGEIFTSLKQYLGNDKDVVAELQQQQQQSPESSTINIKELQEIRDSLLQESETQATHLTNLLEQTYKFQFQIQTLLSCFAKTVTN
ncbi:291_t:CDS:2 [Entrophospora sp. SA101]|nr:291_t:CDS:2 [Entrophospora sp. SA101]CAJ0840675.1 11343_t:CDS:2 [Entrophospora sp. SA101]